MKYAGMAELADAQDLGSCPARGMGSNPTIRTHGRAVNPQRLFN